MQSTYTAQRGTAIANPKIGIGAPERGIRDHFDSPKGHASGSDIEGRRLRIALPMRRLPLHTARALRRSRA